jgi:hypothetical protein
MICFVGQASNLPFKTPVLAHRLSPVDWMPISKLTTSPLAALLGNRQNPIQNLPIG